MILLIVAPSFRDYRTEPKGAQYEISERHLCAAFPFLLVIAAVFYRLLQLTNDDDEKRGGHEVRDRSHNHGFRFTQIL